MMAARYATDEEISSTARMVQGLVDAGYDPTSDHEMQIGVMAYDAAMLVYTHVSRQPPVQLPKKARAGRNDPCPCGSGRKYKKCCIDMDRVPSAANDLGFPRAFGPQIVPQLFDHDATFEDMQRLSRIMDRDPAFASIGFSAAEIYAFMDRASKKEPALFAALTNGDRETSKPALDDLSALFCRECSDLDFGRSVIKDRCVEAAKRVRSSDEVRALATAICLVLMGEASDDPADDPLADLLFRKALFSAVGNVGIVNKVLDRFGGEDELRRLIATNATSVTERMKSIADELSESEADLLRTEFDRNHENLWHTITEEEFPVPLPFATLMALVGRLAATQRNKTPSTDELVAIVETFSRELMEDDYVLYVKMLDGWLTENNGRSDRVVEAVQWMLQLCMTRSIEDLAPTLLLRCIERERWVAFDEEEQDFIDSPPGRDMPALVAEYGAWLKAKGYLGMAERLVLSWEGADLSQVKLPDPERRIA
jgi:SEC-C motif-containing protein